jgi:hypothetical protein
VSSGCFDIPVSCLETFFDCIYTPGITDSTQFIECSNLNPFIIVPAGDNEFWDNLPGTDATKPSDGYQAKFNMPTVKPFHVQ